MIDFKEKLFNPLVVVLLSVAISVLCFFLIQLFIEVQDFWFVLTLCIVLPIAAAYPISLFMIRYHKKIIHQKEELERLDTINKQMFSIISHDVRGPIASMKNVIDVLIHTDLDSKTGKELFAAVYEKIDGLLAFLEDLLHWSKAQIENKKLDPVKFNTEEVIKPIIALYEEVREAKSINLTKGNLSNELYADKESYAFVVRNLLHNAIKFTDKGQKISISTEVNDHKVYTIIEDNGVGIDKKNIAKIMNNQEWFSSSGTSNELGTGLGIQTCIQYLNMQNGKLLIDSELGKGTKMSIVLPDEAHVSK